MNDAKRARRDFETLSVFSYRTPIATVFVPHGSAAEATTHAVLRCLYGPRAHNMFSCTVSTEGRFFAFDDSLLEVFGATRAARDRWHCLYIHEASPDTKGTETSGTMAALSRQLAAEHISVLDVSTLARNFMMVRLENAERALKTLQATLASDTPPAGDAAAAVAAGKDSAGFGLPQAEVRLALLPGEICIGSLRLEQLPACAHALLQLLFFPPGGGAAPSFLHYFEMGGEVSLMAEQAELDALRAVEPETAQALLGALEPSASHGWRALRVTCSSGSDAVGILSAVCRPLAAIPLMNVSTLDANFLLVEGRHLERALALLAPQFDVEQLPTPA